MPNISDYRKTAAANLPRFKSSQELQDMVRAKTPFYVTQAVEGSGTFNGKEVKKWNFTCVPMMGGPEFKFSMGKTPYRDGLVDSLILPTIAQSSRFGPVLLTFGINKNSGRPMYDLEDFTPGSPQAPVAAPAPHIQIPMPGAPISPTPLTAVVQVTAHCPACDEWPVSDQPFLWNGIQYLPHACKVSGKDEMLVVERV